MNQTKNLIGVELKRVWAAIVTLFQNILINLREILHILIQTKYILVPMVECKYYYVTKEICINCICILLIQNNLIHYLKWHFKPLRFTFLALETNHFRIIFPCRLEFIFSVAVHAYQSFYGCAHKAVIFFFTHLTDLQDLGNRREQ